MCNDVSKSLDRTPMRSILPERNMRTRLIIIGREFRKKPLITSVCGLCADQGTAGVRAPEDSGAVRQSIHAPKPISNSNKKLRADALYCFNWRACGTP